ncbi:tudor domain-containing protein 1 [Nilaparvata lugens]|uniref:tudor domain-containing protein 1 n=1 Tax=Nilaparvata lugens TaxID=108931 RepID=UPI00193D74CE|nr:tudor domain-containing protein 1 [Nilaparvata lugens]
MGLALPDSHIQDRLFKQQTLLESLMGTKNISPKGDTTTAKHADEKSEGSVKSESETSSSLLSSGAISKKKKESKNKKQASQYVTPDISDWLPPEPLHSLKFDTSASYVDMDANIYIQDTTSADTLRIIGATLQTKYENSRPSPHDSFWSAGQLCVAKYHADQKWYRGKVMEVLADNRYRVVMVDYGNVEEVKAADMRKNLLMTQVPRQCHPCALKRVKPLSDDGKWPTTVLDQIYGYVVDRQCAVELAGTCGDYSVVDIEVLPGESLIGLLIRLNCAVLTDTNGNARDDDDDSSSSSSSCSSEEVLIEKEIEAATTDDSDAKKSAVSTKSSDDQESETMANQVRICETIPPTFADLTIEGPNPNPAALKSSWLDIMEEEQNKALMDQYRVIEPRYKPLVIPPHIEEIEVEATAIISATTFFFGLVTETADVKMKRVEFTKMQAEMQEIAQDLPLIEMPTEKQVCCSKFQHDGYWYRAEILKVKDKTCILKFVDYGNCECISINEIHELKPEWLNIPIQGALMTLYNLRMAPNVDVKDCAKALNKCIFDKTLTAKIKNYNPLLVEVFTQDGKSVNEELTSQPFYMQID